jgi:hypothetical protein
MYAVVGTLQQEVRREKLADRNTYAGVGTSQQEVRREKLEGIGIRMQ